MIHLKNININHYNDLQSDSNNLRENSVSDKKPPKYNKNDKQFQVVQEI